MHAGLRSALFGSALPLAGFELAMDFRAGWYRSGAVVTRDPAALPGYSFARTGLRADEVSGALVSAGSNTPSILTGTGYFARPLTTNFITNSMMAGADVGVQPTGWTVSGSTYQVVGKGVSLGVPYIDVRYAFDNLAGTAAVTHLFSFISTGAGNAAGPAVQNDIWTLSGMFQVVGGTLPNAMGLFIHEYSAANALLSNGSRRLSLEMNTASPPTRVSYQRTLLSADTTQVTARLQNTIQAGEVADVTLRIWAPQLIKGILPSPAYFVPTTNAVVTVAEDDMRLAQPLPDAADWVAVASAVLPDAASSPASAIGFVFFDNSGAAGNFIYAGRNGSGQMTLAAASGGSVVQNISTSAGSYSAAGRHIVAFGRRAGVYFLMARSPAGGTSPVVNGAGVRDMPVGLNRVRPSRRDTGGFSVNGPVEFVGWRRIPLGFSDNQVAGMLAALA